MAFTGNIRQPKQYSPNSNSGGFQNTFDRLITVTEYDTSKGYLYGVDDKGKKYEVYVNPAEVLRANEAIARKGTNTASYNWMGHSIDEKMKKAIPPKQKVILIRSRVVSNDKVRGVSVTEVHRIGGVPAPEADKTFQGIFTLTARPDEQMVRVSRVQHWNPNGIDIEDMDSLQDLKEKMDEAAASYGTKIGEFNVTKPTIGIQFRALMKTDREYPYAQDDKKAIYEVVDTSVPFDWIPGPLDEEGKEIRTQAHVINGDEMMEFAEMYADHIASHEEFKDKLSDMKVEVCYFYVYPASRNDALLLMSGDPARDKHADKNPLYQLSHRESFVDMANSEKIRGRNAAVNGIIQIGSNRLDKVDGKPVEIPSYWVSKIHANNTRGHVHSFVRTADGYKAEPHESLKLIRNQEYASTATNSNVNESAPVRQSVPTSQTSRPVETKAAPVQAPSVESDFDPFANDMNGGDPFATPESVNETPLEEVQEQQAEKAEATPSRTPRFGSRFGGK